MFDEEDRGIVGMWETYDDWLNVGYEVTLSLSDDDFAKLVAGKTQAQRLFMSGKLKIKGDVMKVWVWVLAICTYKSA